MLPDSDVLNAFPRHSILNVEIYRKYVLDFPQSMVNVEYLRKDFKRSESGNISRFI